MIDKYNSIPLYIQLKDLMIKKIKDEEWEVNSQIPTEKELMKEYEIGRATVRKSISMLVNEGYIYRKKGIGTFVGSRYPSLGFEPLISLTASLKARGIEANNIIVDKRIIEPTEELLDTLKWDKANEFYYLKRIRSIKEKPLAIEESYFSDKFKYIDGKFDLTGSLTKIMLQELRVTIKKVEQVIIPRMPTIEEQKELKIEKDTLVLSTERWIYIEDEENPFYYLKFIILGNIYNIFY